MDTGCPSASRAKDSRSSRSCRQHRDASTTAPTAVPSSGPNRSRRSPHGAGQSPSTHAAPSGHTWSNSGAASGNSRVKRALPNVHRRTVGEIEQGVGGPYEAEARVGRQNIVGHRPVGGWTHRPRQGEAVAVNDVRLPFPRPGPGPGVPVVGIAPDRGDALLQSARVHEGVTGETLSRSGASRRHSHSRPADRSEVQRPPWARSVTMSSGTLTTPRRSRRGAATRGCARRGQCGWRRVRRPRRR